jgi:hypothetical protein
MDLKEFVVSSLTQIIEGIREAQQRAADSGAWVSPAGSEIPKRDNAQKMVTPDGMGYLHDVDFDVALSVSDQGQAGAAAGLQIFGAKLGADGSVTSQNTAVSRIQFTIPVVWPGNSRPEFDNKVQQQRAANYEKLIAKSGPRR